jgi:NAD(P)-dependent dehydrogenase (short-subunit alcohol dehydrogenase family)
VRFAGRTALVVGGGVDGPAGLMGNGRAIALRLAAEGARVAVTDLVLERAQETVAALEVPGLAIQADAADPQACREAVRRAEGLGPLDVVVANVGIGGGGPIGRETVEQYDLAMDVNVRSHWVTAEAALPGMVERGRGSFVFVGSVAGLWSNGFALSYETSKAAVLALARHIAVRYGRNGIRANTVVLGLIASAMAQREQGEQHWREVLPALARQGTPEEAAAAVAFLASDDAAYVSGTELVVDGGLTCRSPDSLLRGRNAVLSPP